jgi:hypothetical protein
MKYKQTSFNQREAKSAVVASQEHTISYDEATIAQLDNHALAHRGEG